MPAWLENMVLNTDMDVLVRRTFIGIVLFSVLASVVITAVAVKAWDRAQPDIALAGKAIHKSLERAAK